MSAFWGTVCYEYRMSIRRWGVWAAFLLAALPYIINVEVEGLGPQLSSAAIWKAAGIVAVSLNFWMPVIGGIVMADRLSRDLRLGTYELLSATPLSRGAYVLGKYTGVVLATLTPVLSATLVLTGIILAHGAPLAMVPAVLVAFLAVNVPTYLFVGAFSLACPAVLPVRVYQVLFTGYWFWGNFINPQAMPTVSHTVLNSSGEFIANGFFRASMASGANPGYTALQGALNLVTLLACATVALVALERYLAWQARQA